MLSIAKPSRLMISLLPTLSLSRRFFFCLGFVFITTGCSLFVEQPDLPTTFDPQSQIFAASYDDTWRAVQISLQTYPIRINNYETGVIETEVIGSMKGWTPPHKKSQGIGRSSRLKVKVLKGKVKGREATRVTVFKEVRKQANFFSDPTPLPSDSLEEKILLYRIGREIKIERRLKDNQQELTL